MIEKLRDSRGWQLLTITTLILIVPLMADINGRIGVIRQMNQEEARLRLELSEAEAEREALKIQLEKVTDAAYLEEWARVDGRMTRPGEVAIIPVFQNQTEQALVAFSDTPTTSDTSPSVSEQWRRLFFDAPVAP